MELKQYRKMSRDKYIREITEVLSDYEMMLYYNPLFHEWQINEMQADKEDLYYKSVGITDYDAVYGIQRHSMSVERLGEKLVGISDSIERTRRMFKRHRALLQDEIKGWETADVAILERYFKYQMQGINIQNDRLHALKKTLYDRELTDRKGRNIQRANKELELKNRKAKAIKTEDRGKIKI
jgi:hypothetical protein